MASIKYDKEANALYVSISDFDFIARPRFELGSRAPKAPMLDRYTTGLLWNLVLHSFIMLPERYTQNVS